MTLPDGSSTPLRARGHCTAFAALLVVTALDACNTPSPEFFGVVAERVVVGENTFAVRVKDDRAEATRLDFDADAVRGGPVARGVLAIERASGCRVVPESFEGDAGVMRTDLDCS